MLNSDPVWLGGDFDGPIIFSEAASALYVAPFATSAQNDFEDADSDVQCHLLLFCQTPLPPIPNDSLFDRHYTEPQNTHLPFLVP